MRSPLIIGLAVIALGIAGCASGPYPTNVSLSQGDVGCEVEYEEQRWVVGPVPDGGSVVIEPDTSALITIRRQLDELTIRALRGSEEGETTGPVSGLNGSWDAEDWTLVDGESFRPVYVRCWQQP